MTTRNLLLLVALASLLASVQPSPKFFLIETKNQLGGGGLKTRSAVAKPASSIGDEGNCKT